jgi:hypothetical protein
VSDKTKTCPQCGGVMAYRLGEYQCSQCDHVEAAVIANPVQAARLPAAAEWRKPREDAPGGGSSPVPGAFMQEDYGRMSTGSAKFDPAPTLNTEKLIFFGVFVARALLSIAVSAANPHSGETGLAAMGPGGAVIGELVSLVLLAVVLYIPFVPLKWCCAGYSCLMGVMGVAGLFFGALLLPVLGVMGSGSPPAGSGFITFLAMIAGILQTAVYLWFASILYRDMQRIDVD